jgi:hypothetical protein
MNTDDKMLEEIRRQAFIRANGYAREEEVRQETRHTVDALQELTGLPRHELQAIAATVNATYDREEENFFSVKNQFLTVCAGLVLSCLVFWAVSRLIL